MKNFEKPCVANNSSPIEEDNVPANPVENVKSAEEKHDAEVTRLFEDARDKLEKVEANAIKQKRQIVVDLAKSLEGKVSIDSICMEIINQLRGQVSASFIRQCLDEKYKQKTRVENARKQQNRQPKSKYSEKLATVTSLNQEDGEDKKGVIVAEVGGNSQTTIQEDYNEEDERDNEQSVSNELPHKKDRNFAAQLTSIQEQEQQQPQNQYRPHESEIKSPNSKDQHFDSVEPEDVPDDPSQMIAEDKTVLTKSSIYNNESDNNNDHIIYFEFSLPYREISEHMRLLFRVIGNEGGVWFSGSIDKINGKVISSKIGRLSQ